MSSVTLQKSSWGTLGMRVPKLVCDRCASRMEVPQTVFHAGILQFHSRWSVSDGNTHVRVMDGPHGDISS
jgi:hypothetical protein